MNEFNKTEQSIIDYYKPLIEYTKGSENFSPDEWKKRSIDLMLDFYPSRENLTDEELLREKYYSKEGFIFDVSIKRFVEWSGIGTFRWINDYPTIGVRMGEGF